jgi:serine/threonine protein kinase
MPLSAGTRLGPYEILTPIGAGGMGEVYHARDTKLDRDVAIKILPEFFASDPDRLARFEREAKTLASLNHPNIAQIHGLEERGSTRALIMELVVLLPNQTKALLRLSRDGRTLLGEREAQSWSRTSGWWSGSNNESRNPSRSV